MTASSLGTMLLERRSRPARGVKVVRREAAPFGTQIVPTRMLTEAEVGAALRRVTPADGPVVTSALSPIEQAPFAACGFVERETLHLLRHDFTSRPRRVRNGVKIGAARRRDLERILAIDQASFDDFWRFDRTALMAARRATPVHRYVAARREGRVIGYAVTGVAGSTSYLQRLAVDPSARRTGVGTQLVHDAIEWAIGRGTLAMLVNTQEKNASAVQLYRSLGFRLDDHQLKVLEWRPTP